MRMRIWDEVKSQQPNPTQPLPPSRAGSDRRPEAPPPAHASGERTRSHSPALRSPTSESFTTADKSQAKWLSSPQDASLYPRFHTVETNHFQGHFWGLPMPSSSGPQNTFPHHGMTSRQKNPLTGTSITVNDVHPSVEREREIVREWADTMLTAVQKEDKRDLPVLTLAGSDHKVFVVCSGPLKTWRHSPRQHNISCQPNSREWCQRICKLVWDNTRT